MMASRQDGKQRLENAVRAVVARAMGKKEPEVVDAVTDAMLKALRAEFAIGIRRPRPRRETERALSMRLPVGVEITHKHKGKVFTVRVVSERAVELEYDGQVEVHKSLKAVAVSILGYVPSFGGWRFFFGTLDHDEVLARYGKKPS